LCVRVSGAVFECRYCWDSTKKHGAGGVEAGCRFHWRSQRTSNKVCFLNTQHHFDSSFPVFSGSSGYFVTSIFYAVSYRINFLNSLSCR